MPSRNSVLSFSCAYLNFSSSTSIFPFLYQTRTLESPLLFGDEKQIIHSCRAHRSFCFTPFNHTIPFEHSVSSKTTAKQSSHRDGSRKSDFRRLNPSRFTKPPDTKGNLQFSPSQTTASGLINPHSTLTASEKAVFDKIFKDIALSKKEEDSSKNEFGDEFSSEFGDEFRGEVTEDMHKIFENAIERQSSLEENPAAALSIAPQSPEAIRLDSLRKSHEKSFTKKLHSSQTDIEVWTLLEQELFSFFRPVTKRDKDTKPSDPAPSVKKGKAPKKERKKETDSTTKKVLYEREDLLSVMQKNYGEYCLSAMRLLRREFPSSPYVLRLLPTIKQLGHISYVLGASTALYNEILFIKWTQYTDLDGIADLVTEMLHKGVDVNEVSINLLVAVAKERQRALSADGDVDQASKAWWRLSGVQESWNRVRLWLDASIQDLRRRRVSEEREQMNDEDKDNVDGGAAEVALREDSVEQG